jgi:hypothetical protein
MLSLLLLRLNITYAAPKVKNPNFGNLSPTKIRCSDFYSHNDAQIFFESQKGNSDNYSHLDKDRDGAVCE